MFRLNETIKRYKEINKKRAGEIDYGSDESVKRLKKQTPGETVEESKDTPPREYDYEGEMTKQQLRTIEMAAKELQGMISDNQNLPEWWQNKITLAADYMQTARDYMKSDVKEEKDSRLTRAGVSGFNKAKRTPGHPTKSHIVVAKQGDKVKTIRFGQQGASTAGDPKKGESAKMKAKRKSFKARHGRNIAKGKMSAAYWADKEKW